MKKTGIKVWLSRTINFSEEILLYQKRSESYGGYKPSLFELSSELCTAETGNVSVHANQAISELQRTRLEIEEAISIVKCSKARTLLARRYLHGEAVKNFYNNPYSKCHVMRLFKESENEIIGYLKRKRGMVLGD